MPRAQFGWNSPVPNNTSQDSTLKRLAPDARQRSENNSVPGSKCRAAFPKINDTKDGRADGQRARVRFGRNSPFPNNYYYYYHHYYYLLSPPGH
eukprot:11833593-Heterocapsa_arctica.AAC.1